MASPKFTAMMKARRGFDVRPVSAAEVEAGRAPLEALLQMASRRQAGVYVMPDVPTMRAYGVGRPTAFYTDIFGNGRAVRRHEVMHGMRDAAMADPSLRAAIPWWARGGEWGGFQDELLARLASKDKSQIRDWNTAAYPRKSLGDRAMYGVFDAGRLAAENPAAVAGALTGTGLLAYGLSIPEEPAVADEPHSLDRIIERLGRQ